MLFGRADYVGLTSADFTVLEEELTTIAVTPSDELVDILLKVQLATSKTEARRFLQESAVYINGSQFSLDKTTIDVSDALHGYIVIKRGKNALALLKLK